MSNMKRVAIMAQSRYFASDYKKQFKRALSIADKQGINYVVIEGEVWTTEQAQGIIRILEDKLNDPLSWGASPNSDEW